MAASVDIRDLVENPRETQEIEVKSWIDLADPVQRAKIARHIAAIANHGGGHILYGFDNKNLRPIAPPSSTASYNRDNFSAIVMKYLDPVVGVELFWSERGGVEFPVLRIPPHGVLPIRARADGPQDEKGRPQGIAINTYYIRTEQPASDVISTARQWESLIRRCVLADKERLLETFGHILQGRAITPQAEGYGLADWHTAAATWYKDGCASPKVVTRPVPLAENHYQMSYRIRHDGPPLTIAQLRDHVLQSTVSEVQQIVSSGWSMFYPFTRSEVAPYVQTIAMGDREEPILELDFTKIDLQFPDAWRISPDGWATLLRGYREDSNRATKASDKQPGTWLSPYLLVRELTEFLAHARAIAKNYNEPSTIEVEISWHGLKNRQLSDVMYDFRPAIAHASNRNYRMSWPIEQLQTYLFEKVAETANALLQIFGGFEANATWIEHVRKNFRTA